MKCDNCDVKNSDALLRAYSLCLDCPETVEYCPVCHTARKNIISTQKVGCPSCYQIFRREIQILRGRPGKVNEPVRN